MSSEPDMDDIDILSGESTIQQWSDAVAAASATPAGGAVAALASALAAALVAMVAGLTTRREKYAAVHGLCSGDAGASRAAPSRSPGARAS